MSYCASFSGELTLREGLTEEQLDQANNMLDHYFEDVNENKSDGVTYYEINGGGDDRYYQEDYKDLARLFDGQVDFVGEDNAKWSLFLEDGRVKETSPIEIKTLPDEDTVQSIARYIYENDIDLDLVVLRFALLRINEQETDQEPSQEQEQEDWLELS